MSKRDLDKILRTNKQRGNTRCSAKAVCVPVGDTVWEHHAYRYLYTMRSQVARRQLSTNKIIPQS